MTNLALLLQLEGYIPFCALLGLCIGSFLNVVIHRLPLMMENEWRMQCEAYIQEAWGAKSTADRPGALLQSDGAMREIKPPPISLFAPRSRCPQCKHLVRAIDNIPVLSYFILRGRCRDCKARISWRYPALEALTGILFAIIGWQMGASYASIGAMIFVSAMIALAAIDWDTQLLPDSITLPLIWAGLIFNLENMFVGLKSAVLGAALGYLILWGTYWSFRIITGKEGMGYGDFKLLAAIGAWLGWQMLPLTLLLSAVLGLLISGSAILLKRQERQSAFPFGPYLAIAGTAGLFAGQYLTQAYLRLLT